MDRGSIERRRGRRVSLDAPLQIRQVGASEPRPVKDEVTRNISLAGVYFETDEDAYTLNDVVITSVSIPESRRREFPFTRIAGRGRIVRVNELPPQTVSGRKRLGIALEFAEDVTALTATPTRG